MLLQANFVGEAVFADGVEHRVDILEGRFNGQGAAAGDDESLWDIALSRQYTTKFVVFFPSTYGMKLAVVWLQAWQRGYIMAIAIRVLSTSEDPPSHRP